MENSVLNLEISEKNCTSDIDFANIEYHKIEVFIHDDLNLNLNFFNFDFLKEINIFVGKNVVGKINLFENESECDIILRCNLNDNADLVFNNIDFLPKNKKIDAKVILFGDYSSCRWNSSVLSNEKCNKSYNISFSHIGEKSKSIMNNYGVCKDSSTIIFDGVSHIEKSAKKSLASQNAKIIIYDKECSAYANPKLLIDYDDVVANHSAAVGTLNEEHIFYLLSRGLSIKEARKLITFGYLKPILSNLDEEYKEKYEKILGDLM